MEVTMIKLLELYIHIPFCMRKCAYCDFLSFASTELEQESYVEAMLVELEGYREMASQYLVSSMFIGGGTPSVLNESLLICIMKKVREIFTIDEDAEISIEVNPGTVTAEKIAAYYLAGINRVSIGLQATNDDELQMLGRIHCYEEFLETYHLIKEVGIRNINVDLISAIPKQTVESWTETLERIIALEPTHVSAYSLIIEEGTLFHDKLEDYENLLPDEDAEREMYHLTKTKLANAGYHRYEISNYAKGGYECQHNLGYWERVDYLGIGLGSASLINNIRYSNERNLKSYIEKCGIYAESTLDEEHRNEESCEMRRIVNGGVRVEAEVLSREAQMEEFMFLGLRKIEGVSKRKFFCEFGATVEDVYGKVIEKLKKQNLLSEEADFLRLTDDGVDISNRVMAEFLIS